MKKWVLFCTFILNAIFFHIFIQFGGKMVVQVENSIHVNKEHCLGPYCVLGRRWEVCLVFQMSASLLISLYFIYSILLFVFFCFVLWSSHDNGVNQVEPREFLILNLSPSNHEIGMASVSYNSTTEKLLTFLGKFYNRTSRISI